MGLVTIKDYPVIVKYYYIVSFKDLLNVRLFPHYYLNRNAAKRAIKANFPKKKWKRYQVMRGSQLRDYNLVYSMSRGLGKFTKYEYPDDRVTKQKRKTYRTVMRRRLRRMGLLTLGKPKKSIKSQPDIIKPIKNKQKVAMNKNSAAKVIRIERLPSHYYYLVLSAKPAKKKGYLFRLKVLKFDKLKGSIKKMILITRRTDILIPYLITDLEYLIYEQIQKCPNKRKAIAYYSKYGFRVHGLLSKSEDIV